MQKSRKFTKKRKSNTDHPLAEIACHTVIHIFNFCMAEKQKHYHANTRALILVVSEVFHFRQLHPLLEVWQCVKQYASTLSN
ncbi:hypothetical protein HHO41_03700 [Bacillus sp. DNRA2]|uniref:hypothetical protein n=1 Tax=Bacillus sp. DNRA2 TaxID=2723053 RepID=UPI00145E06F3|nr:hypothetical protein [Bacillus sp. DNRA2]NMD69380.1 hypothetical protein [Bacillus sp. DNRA2]